MKKKAQEIFDFVTFLEQFKKLERFRNQVYWREYNVTGKFESNADHSWRIAMILVVIEKKLTRPIDFEKAMKMALIHDIPEIITGDPSPLGSDGTGKDSHAYNEEAKRRKHENEKRAAKKIFSMLPKPGGDELYNIWLEFEEGKTYEARVVTALDKFEGKLQALEYTGGRIYKEHYKFFRTYGVETFSVDPIVKEIGDILIRDLDKKFTEYGPPENPR